MFLWCRWICNSNLLPRTLWRGGRQRSVRSLHHVPRPSAKWEPCHRQTGIRWGETLLPTYKKDLAVPSRVDPIPSVFFDTQTCFQNASHYAKHVLKYVKYLSLKEIGCTVAKCWGTHRVWLDVFRLGLSAHQSQLVINAHSFFSIVFQLSGRGSSRSAVKCHVT